MDKDTVGSRIVGIEKLRKAVEGDKQVFLVGRGAQDFILAYFDSDVRHIYDWLARAHPSDVKHMVQHLSREWSQKLMSTCNPLVLNELEPEQVFLLTHWGERVTPITETINFADRAKVYALGELWLSYLRKTDDDSEPDLVEVPHV